MQIANKIRIYPTKEQEEQLFQFAGTSRFAWNESLSYRTNRYENEKILLFSCCSRGYPFNIFHKSIQKEVNC